MSIFTAIWEIIQVQRKLDLACRSQHKPACSQKHPDGKHITKEGICKIPEMHKPHTLKMSFDKTDGE